MSPECLARHEAPDGRGPERPDGSPHERTNDDEDVDADTGGLFGAKNTVRGTGGRGVLNDHADDRDLLVRGGYADPTPRGAVHPAPRDAGASRTTKLAGASHPGLSPSPPEHPTPDNKARGEGGTETSRAQPWTKQWIDQWSQLTASSVFCAILQGFVLLFLLFFLLLCADLLQFYALPWIGGSIHPHLKQLHSGTHISDALTAGMTTATPTSHGFAGGGDERPWRSSERGRKTQESFLEDDEPAAAGFSTAPHRSAFVNADAQTDVMADGADDVPLPIEAERTPQRPRRDVIDVSDRHGGGPRHGSSDRVGEKQLPRTEQSIVSTSSQEQESQEQKPQKQTAPLLGAAPLLPERRELDDLRSKVQSMEIDDLRSKVQWMDVRELDRDLETKKGKMREEREKLERMEEREKLERDKLEREKELVAREKDAREKELVAREKDAWEKELFGARTGEQVKTGPWGTTAEPVHLARDKWVKRAKAPHTPSPYVWGTMAIATRLDAPMLYSKTHVKIQTLIYYKVWFNHMEYTNKMCGMGRY